MIVYKVTCLETNKIYIGKTVNDILVRKRHHYWEARHGSRSYFHNALRKYDESAFIWEVLDAVMFSDLLFDLERFYIARYNCMSPNGYNLTSGGEGATGRILSKEAKDKIGAANKGRVVSAETRIKLSKAALGKKLPPLSEETKGKLRVVNLGKKLSEETKNKMRARRASDETKKKMSISQKERRAKWRAQNSVN
jgi:group I intron endonuclease